MNDDVRSSNATMPISPYDISIVLPKAERISKATLTATNTHKQIAFSLMAPANRDLKLLAAFAIPFQLAY